MEYLTIQKFLEYGTPGILLMLILTNLYLIITVNYLKITINDMKTKIVWRDTHMEIEKADRQRFDDIGRRIERLENKTDG